MNVKNGDNPAMPAKITLSRDEEKIHAYQFANRDFCAPGLTKREMFAMAAMQALASATDREGNWTGNHEQTAKQAVKMADNLLNELEKTGD